ncbi:MAG: ribonuclease E/G [Acidobacteria bacterium]|nr:MAG: ribonuclease E/G [Acidobacteriota bacterium]
MAWFRRKKSEAPPESAQVPEAPKKSAARTTRTTSARPAQKAAATGRDKPAGQRQKSSSQGQGGNRTQRAEGSQRSGQSRSASSAKRQGGGGGSRPREQAQRQRGQAQRQGSGDSQRRREQGKPKPGGQRSQPKNGQRSKRPAERRPLTTEEIKAVTEPKHMCVHVGPERTQIAILEGKDLVEHYTTRKDHSSIAGNIYQGKVQNVLPGMEAAFVDIGTSKNGVLYVGDVQWDELDVEPGAKPKIEQVLQKGQSVLVQVTKDPMGTKGARLTTQISLPGRFLVVVPESGVQGISRRLPAGERDRLRRISSAIKPEGFGLIIRTAAEGASESDLKADVERLQERWYEIYSKAREGVAPALLYEEPELVIKVFRETFGPDFKKVTIDDKETYDRVMQYLDTYEPDLKGKVDYYPPDEIPLFDRYHVTSQLQKGLDRKVWLPSGGHVVIDRTEALTVIDVNTGKNVGKSNLEETVFKNNLEAAEEISRQLRLRDIGGIIVIDFIDMEIRKNRQEVLQTFRECLAKDKTRTQVFDISELGLLEMTRKNVSEGLVEAYSHPCEACNGRGLTFDSLD